MFAASNAAIKAARIFPDLPQFSRRMPPGPLHAPSCIDANRISHRDFLPLAKTYSRVLPPSNRFVVAVPVTFSRTPTTICAERYTIASLLPVASDSTLCFHFLCPFFLSSFFLFLYFFFIFFQDSKRDSEKGEKKEERVN